MAVHNLIFRIDFKPNYLIIDSAGFIMSMLKDMGENYWSEFGDSITTRAITAFYNSDNAARQITVEPTSINFTIETSKITEIESLSSQETYLNLMKMVHQFCKHFKIVELQRAGLRLVTLKAIGDNRDLKPLFAKVIDSEIDKSINTSLGNGTDYGLVVDGEDKDKIKYHLKFGPYGKEEANKYFAKLNKPISELEYNFICDVDQYEDNFTLHVNPAKWAEDLLIKNAKFITNIERSLIERLLK